MMTVVELREALANLRDDLPVMIHVELELDELAYEIDSHEDVWAVKEEHSWPYGLAAVMKM